jgi:V8-like Glu-specific endopeptidase
MKLNYILPLTICCALLLVESARGDDKLVVRREVAFARVGLVHTQTFQLWPVNKASGMIFEQNVVSRIPGNSMRLHVTINFSSVVAPWTLKAIDGSGAEWSIKSELTSGDFWTGDLEGTPIKIQLFSDSATNPVKLIIDKIAVSTPPIKPQSIVGPDDRKPILTQSPQVKGWGSSVARIRFIGDDGIQYLCTGFLVATRLLITNQHCLSSPTEVRSALVDFNYDSNTSKVATVTCIELVAIDEALDYSIVRLSANPGIGALKLTSSDVLESQPLLVIEHPGGETKQVSIIDCKVDHSSISGTTSSATDFGHDCDTLGGSSGSPVQDIITGDVVGLHHLGIPEGTNILMNRAVKMKLILQNLAAKSPAAIAEIETGGH